MFSIGVLIWRLPSFNSLSVLLLLLIVALNCSTFNWPAGCLSVSPHLSALIDNRSVFSTIIEPATYLWFAWVIWQTSLSVPTDPFCMDFNYYYYHSDKFKIITLSPTQYSSSCSVNKHFLNQVVYQVHRTCSSCTWNQKQSITSRGRSKSTEKSIPRKIKPRVASRRVALCGMQGGGVFL